MRVALAQINSVLGDFETNSKAIVDYAKRAIERRADIVLFPEASLFGYHPMDLLERPSVVEAQLKALKKLIRELPKDIAVVFGAFTPNPKKNGKPFYNSAIVVNNKRVVFQRGKTLLPTYDVFDDARHIEAGDLSKNIFRYKGQKILLTICEDIWAWPSSEAKTKSLYPHNPIKDIKPGSVDLVLNLSASPFHIGKMKERHAVVTKTAKYLRAPLVYVNMVGAQDELIFDGGSFAVNKSGKVLSQSVQFQEDLNIVDFKDHSGGMRSVAKTDIEQIRQALVLGIRDFTKKIGITKVHLGLSGGIDSSVVACLAADAMGPKNVVGFALPGPFSDVNSLAWAKLQAQNLGIQFKEINITPGFNNIKSEVNSSLGQAEFGVTEENLQSRLRAIFLMAYSNRSGSLLLNTSNKSEFAAGYSTLYGDLCGGLSVIGDLLKGDVYKLAKHYNHEDELIPKGIIERAPSAELRPNQKDQDTLPPYDQLDSAVINLVEKRRSPKTQAEKFLLPVLFRSEFKRWQAPPVLKVRAHSFGRGRRMPVAHKAYF